MKKASLCLFMLICCCAFVNAQQVVSSGGYNEKEGITVNWILGGYLEDLTGYTKSTLPEPIEGQLTDSEFSVKVYPTFTKNFITVEISPFGDSRFYLDLYNNIGVRIMDRITMDQPVLQVNLSNLPLSIYFLRVFCMDKELLIESVKIVKM